MPTPNNQHNQPLPKLPIVSAIVVCQNNESTIKQCIESISTQDYPAIQTLIIDRDSKDNTQKIISDLSSQQTEFKLNNKPFKYCNIQPAPHIGKAKNIGIKMLLDQSHLFAIINPKSVLFDNYISESIVRFIEYPDQVGITYTDFIQSNGFVYYKSPYERSLIEQDSDLIGTSIILNKISLQSVNFYEDNLDIYEDYDVALKIGVSHILIHIPKPLYQLYD